MTRKCTIKHTPNTSAADNSATPSPLAAAPIEQLSAEDARHLLQELQTHQVELELQNEELRRTQQQLEIARMRFMGLYNNAPIGYVALDPSGIIHQANATFIRMVKREHSDVHGTAFANYIAAGDEHIFRSRYRTFFRNPENKHIELLLQPTPLISFYARLEAVPHQYHGAGGSKGNYDELLVTVSDISEQRRSREKVAHLNRVLLAIRNVNQIIIRQDDPQSLIKAACENFVQTRGYQTAWIALLDKSGKPEIFAEAGLSDTGKELIDIIVKGTLPHCALAALAQHEVYSSSDAAAPCGQCLLGSSRCTQLAMAVRLQHGDTLHGLLAVSIPEAMNPDDDEKQLLQEVAADIAFALHDRALQRERQRAQQQLRHKEAVLSRSQQIAHLGSWELDFETNQFTWSDEVFRIFGYPPQVWEPSYERLLLSVHPDDRQLVDTAFSDSLRPGCHGYQVKHRILRPWGEIRFVHEKCEHQRDEQGQLVRAVGMIQDITERKEAEDAIAAEKEQLAVTLRSIGDGVITTDIGGNVVIMNTEAERLTGWSQQEAIGRLLSEVFCVVDEISRAPRGNPAQEVLRSGALAEHTSHTLLVSRDGSERIIADSAAPINNRQGDTTGVVLVFRDTTEKQKLLETMHRADKLDSLGILAGGIAHDFNNLLGGIFGYIDLAQESCSGNQVAVTYLDKALIAYGRAKNLTQQLLTFAKGDSPVRKSCDIKALLNEAISFSLSGSSISCEYMLDNELRACLIDDNQISQVLNNITINAQQAMPQGGVLRVAAHNCTLDNTHPDGLRAGAYVSITLSDSGIGIPPENLSRIFDPFFTTKHSGCGLGLATSYSIIQKHDGRISVESEPGKGTTFTILLPAATITHESAPAPARLAHQGSGCVLVMDDEECIREIAKQMLSRMGYAVVEASRGEEVVEIIAQSTFPTPLVAALFDLTIPGGMGGRETVAQLRERFPDLPVFASSGYSEDPVMSNPGAFGFSDSICKPYRAAELQALLQRHLH